MATTNLNPTGGENQPDPLTGDPHPHKPAEDTEQIYFEGTPMLRAELAKGWYWVLAGVVVLAIPIVIRVLHNPDKGEPFAWWWFLVALVVAAILVFVPWVMTKTVKYKITNYRIDFERGLIAKRIDTLELWHVEDISLTQGVLDRILGVGTMTVVSHDSTTPRLPMRGLPNPRPLFETLKQRVIAVKRQRGVVKMDIG